MVLWQSNLRTSWQAQWTSLLLHGAVILSLLLTPWSPDYTVAWMMLMVLAMLECAHSQRRILCRKGLIVLLSDRRVRWRQQECNIIRRPWRIGQLILLSVRNQKGQSERLWLMRDSMDEAAWRQLRQCLFTYKII